MNEITNLNRERKARAKAARKVEAAANRVRFGASKPARERVRLIEDRAQRLHDSRRLEERE